MIEITREQWRKFAPKCPVSYSDALFNNIDLLRDAGILDSEYRWCHFIGTVYEETGGFTEIRENLFYTTAARLRQVWPSRFGHKGDDELKRLLRNPRALAEEVYGGRMGNRPGTSDAYDTRGGGWFNTTGYGTVRAYCEKLGIPYASGVLDDPVATLKFAVLEWTETDCNACADENDLTKVAKAINTGSATSNVKPVGMADRQKAFARAWKIWGESGDADVPATPIDVKGLAIKYGLPLAGGTAGGTTVLNNAVTAPAAPVLPAASKSAESAVDMMAGVKQIGGALQEFMGWAQANPKIAGPAVLLIIVPLLLPYVQAYLPKAK